MRSRFKLFMIMTLLFSPAANIRADTVKDYSFSDTSKIAKVPFEPYLNLIFLQARVNNSRPLWFMLDSGFEGTVINSSTAGKLGLEISGNHQENAPGGEIVVAYIDSLNFQLPGLEISNQRVKAILLDSLEPVVGRKIDGVLGYDYFNRFVIEISYSDQIITLVSPEKFIYAGNGTAVPVEIENDESFIYAYLESESHPQIRAKLKVDTGSADALGLNGSFVRAEALLGPADRKIPASGAAVGGYTKNYVVRLKTLKIGDIALENLVTGFSDDTTRTGDAGTIGGEIFRRFKMTFNYSHHLIYLEKNSSFNDPFEYDMSDIFPVADGPDFKTIKIQSMANNSPASEAGLQPNDIILKIDGKPASDYSIAAVRQAFKVDGKTVHLEIKRGGKTFGTELKLRRLI